MANRLGISLLLLRIGVFAVMLMWTVDKFVNPDHAIGVFKAFYFFPEVSHTVAYAIGAVEIVLIFAFVIGLWKTFTYGAVLILHGISTILSFKAHFAPWEGPHILFFTAWPMLAACIALFLMRDEDRVWSV